MERLILIKYGEIHLKGLNRPFFKRMLIERLAETLRGLHCDVYEMHGRVYVSQYDAADEAEAVARCQDTFGVVGVCPALVVDKTMDDMERAAIMQMRDAKAQLSKCPVTFKVHARREDKTFVPNSDGIAREIGARVLHADSDVKVDVHNPNVMVEIEVRDKAYVYAAVLPGVGGMPVGSSGQAVLMLSGGIDSPVAGYMMAKRGIVLSAVHFMSPPHTGEAAKQKVLDLTKRLARYCGTIPLYMVTFTRIQEAIYEGCRPNLLTVLMRRAMIGIAQNLALQNGAKALITGESLGQVASQTLESLCATNDVAKMPVFRPLIGMDKNDIIAVAKRIQTFDISIRPGEDCCTVFVPKHPKTKPVIEKLREQEQNIPWDALIEQSVNDTQCLMVDP